MTWIRTADENEASGALKDIYRQDVNTMGFVMEATKAFSARPEIAAACAAFREAVRSTPGLSLRERRLINMVVAHHVRSWYCTVVFAAALERDVGRPAGVRAILEDHREAGLSAREAAILDYAVAAAAGRARPEHIARLREAGLDDAAILDVAVAANLRQFGSRVFAALGVEPDPFFLEQTGLVQAIPAEARRPAVVIPQGFEPSQAPPRRLFLAFARYE